MNRDNVYIVEWPTTKGGNVWFDGYMGQKRVVLDDYRSYHLPFNFLLRLLDRYPIQVPVKGGYVNFIPEEIIVTSPFDIQECF